MKAHVEASGIELTHDVIPGGAEGVSKGGSIVIAPGLETAEEFAVLAHELAHELLHKDEERRTRSKTVKETEAEAVSFVVCQAIGLDCSTRSSDYIQLYQGDAETLSESLDAIQKTAASIIEAVTDKAGI